MVKTLIIAALCACSATAEYPIDSTVADSAVAEQSPPQDAARAPQENGCATMGLLPAARTITLAPDDPVPSTLLNEIQDNIVGRKTTAYPRRFLPGQWTNSSGVTAPTCITGVVNSVQSWRFTTNDSYVTVVPFNPNERLVGFSMDVLGDGVCDVVANVFYYATPSTTDGARVSVSNKTMTNQPGGAWANVAFTMTSNQVLSTTGVLLVSMVLTSAGTFNVGHVTPVFDRL